MQKSFQNIFDNTLKTPCVQDCLLNNEAKGPSLSACIRKCNENSQNTTNEGDGRRYLSGNHYDNSSVTN